MTYTVSLRFISVMIGCLLFFSCEDDKRIEVIVQLRIEKRDKVSQINQLKQEIDSKQQQIKDIPEQFEKEKQRKIAELTEQLSQLKAKCAESIISITKEQLQTEYKVFRDKVSLFIGDELSNVSVQQAEEIIAEGKNLQSQLSLKVQQLNSEVKTLDEKIVELKKQIEGITEGDPLKERINAHIEKLGEEKNTREINSKEVNFSLKDMANLLNKLEKYKQALIIVEQ